MYDDRDSIKAFERLHARDHLAQLAHHIGESAPDGLFGAHARSEARDGMLGIALSLAVVGALVGAAAVLLWR